MKKMLQSNIVTYIKMRKNQTMEEIQKNQCLCEADVYILEIGYQCYLQKISLDICKNFIKSNGFLIKQVIIL